VQGDISIGRNPLRNLVKTVHELARPSFLDIWSGSTHFEYKNTEGEVLRVENRREVESNFVWALLRAIATTVKIGTLGSFLASVLGFPLGAVSAKNIRAPSLIAFLARFILGCSRSIHTLIFGLLFVGIFGLGPTAGILAIAAHSLGSFGKLYAESIETLDMTSIDSVRAVGASEMQIFFNAVWPAILPQVVSTNIYLWEFNIRDSTVLGLIGAGGLGLLISEATSLFLWARLSSILMAVIALVYFFDYLSRRIRTSLL
jgi:phosphonate transport system permease protein